MNKNLFQEPPIKCHSAKCGGGRHTVILRLQSRLRVKGGAMNRSVASRGRLAVGPPAGFFISPVTWDLAQFINSIAKGLCVTLKSHGKVRRALATCSLLGVVSLTSCAHSPDDHPPFATSHIVARAKPMGALTTWMKGRGFFPSPYTGLEASLPPGTEFQWYEKAYPKNAKLLALLSIDRAGALHVDTENSVPPPSLRKQMDHDYIALARDVDRFYTQSASHAGAAGAP